MIIGLCQSTSLLVPQIDQYQSDLSPCALPLATKTARFLCCLLFAILTALTAVAQSRTGELRLGVTDPAGAVLQAHCEIVSQANHFLLQFETNAEGEYTAAEKLAMADEVIQRQPVAIQLRYLQTLVEIGAEKNTTVVFPLPIDFLNSLMGKS